MKLHLYGAQVVRTVSTPGEDGPTLTLTVEFDVSRAVAERLRCAETFFDGAAVLRTTIANKALLNLVIDGGEVCIGQERASCHADSIYKFLVWRDEEGTLITLRGSCTARFSKDRAAVWGLCDELNEAFTTISIDAAQQDFDFMNDPDDEPVAAAEGPTLADVREVKKRSTVQ